MEWQWHSDQGLRSWLQHLCLVEGRPGSEVGRPGRVKECCGVGGGPFWQVPPLNRCYWVVFLLPLLAPLFWVAVYSCQDSTCILHPLAGGNPGVGQPGTPGTASWPPCPIPVGYVGGLVPGVVPVVTLGLLTSALGGVHISSCKGFCRCSC